MNFITQLLKIQKGITPAQVVSISFVFVIFFGAAILSLPISQQTNTEISSIDAIFTSVSAVCVTGLVTLTTATTWSLFGKIIILCLIQIGGLSLITIYTFFIVHLGKKITLKDRLTVQAAFNVSDLNGMVRMVMMVVRGTLLCEGVGAVLLTIIFIDEGMVWYKALFQGIFHSIAAFCNAGFDNIGEQSLNLYATNPALCTIIMILIILGGIGFSVWRDFCVFVHNILSLGYRKRMRLSVHSKLAVLTSSILIVSGALYFFIFEYLNPQTMGMLSVWQKLLVSLFQSVTMRTAGFSTIPQGGLNEISKLVSSVFMLIGGSPGGTAGGIKTVTVAILLCCVISTLKGRQKVSIFERSLPINTVRKALALATVMLFLWFMGSLLLSATEANSVFSHTMTDLLFETASALGTVGLTTGITPFLSSSGKIIIMLFMIIGRIGPLVIILSLSNRNNLVNEKILYPEEDVMIG